MTGGLRKWHFEGHHLYCSPNVTRMIRLRGITWAGNVAHMGQKFQWETEGRKSF